MNEDLSNLKIGDEVHTHNYMGERIEKVTGLTDKQIIVGDTRYWKRNGRQVGGDAWGRSYLDMPTDEARNRIRKEQLVRWAGKFDWNTMNLETLKKVYALVLHETR